MFDNVKVNLQQIKNGMVMYSGGIKPAYDQFQWVGCFYNFFIRLTKTVRFFLSRLQKFVNKYAILKTAHSIFKIKIQLVFQGRKLPRNSSFASFDELPCKSILLFFYVFYLPVVFMFFMWLGLYSSASGWLVTIIQIVDRMGILVEWLWVTGIINSLHKC